jgi:CBS domain containing-hemolysin-like protein
MGNTNHLRVAVAVEMAPYRANNTLYDARSQADAHDCAVIYPGPHGHRVAMPGDSRTGGMNVQYWGRFDDVVEALKIEGIPFEILEVKP